MRNKRGNLSVIILVLGTFAICALAMLTFYISDFRISKSFVGISYMHQINSDIDEYRFYKSQGLTDSQLENFYNIDNRNNINYIYLNKTTSKFSLNPFSEEREELLFSVEYPIS